MNRFSLTFAVLAISVAVVGCDKKPAEDTAPKTESSDKKSDKSKDDKSDDKSDKSKDDKSDDDKDPTPVAKTDDSAAAADSANPPDPAAEAVPVPSDYAEAAQATIKPEDDYKSRLTQLETDIGKE